MPKSAGCHQPPPTAGRRWTSGCKPDTTLKNTSVDPGVPCGSSLQFDTRPRLHVSIFVNRLNTSIWYSHPPRLRIGIPKRTTALGHAFGWRCSVGIPILPAGTLSALIAYTERAWRRSLNPARVRFSPGLQLRWTMAAEIKKRRGNLLRRPARRFFRAGEAAACF